jgi:hypothetical protein
VGSVYDQTEAPSYGLKIVGQHAVLYLVLDIYLVSVFVVKAKTSIRDTGNESS